MNGPGPRSTDQTAGPETANDLEQITTQPLPRVVKPASSRTPPLAEDQWAARIMSLLSAGVRGDRGPVLLILALPFVVWLPGLLGFVDANSNTKAILGHTTRGYLNGAPTADPGIAFVAQALGHQAAAQWLAGQVPWWNPYEAVGMPLAAGMQSAAFFPLTLLLIFSWGQLALNICLQLIAGVATYALLRQLRLGRKASLVGGVLYEFNGVFAIMGNSIVTPLPFLPLLLLGIERAFLSEASPERRAERRWYVHGWKWIVVALWLSYVAGFPEVAYINGLLATLWVVVRGVGLRSWLGRARYALKVGMGFVLATALAAPLLVAFASYLPLADLGLNGGRAGSIVTYPAALLSTFYPWAYGGINAVRETSFVYGNAGGFLGLSVVFLALCGVLGRRERALRLVLGAWIVVALGKTFGLAPFMMVINALPFANRVVFSRYANASWILAAVILAAFAVDEWRGTRADKARVVVCAALTLGGLSLGSLWLALPYVGKLWGDPNYHPEFLVVSVAVEWMAVLALVAVFLAGRSAPSPSGDGGPASRLPIEATRSRVDDGHRARAKATASPRARWQAAVAGTTVMLLAMIYFLVPILAYPRSASIDYAAINYLRAHIGFNRFVTLSPFTANYGSYFDIASVNDNDMPVPHAWDQYIHEHLDPYAKDGFFINIPRQTPADPKMTTVVQARVLQYEQAGVKYVLWCACAPLFTNLPPAERPPMVYHDATMQIYELPHPAPFFEAHASVNANSDAGGGQCQVRPTSWETAEVTCAAPSTLLRRSMSFPGWHAEVNGREVPIAQAGELFQQIALPAGSAHVTFWYLPPHEEWAFAVAGLALALFIAATLFALTHRRGPPTRAGTVVRAG